MTASRPLLTKKIRGAAAQLRHLPRVWQLIWSAAHRWSVLWAVLLVVQGLLPVAIVLLTRELVDSLSLVMATSGAIGASVEWHRVAPVLVPAVLMGGVLLLGELLRGAADWVRAVQARLVEDHVSGLIHEKSVNVDLAFYESPDFYDHLHRARAEASSRPIALLENGGSLIQNAITLAAMAAVLLPYGLWMPVALLLSTLPALVVVLRFALHQHRLRLRTTGDERRSDYYDWLMTDGGAAAELRLFGLGDHYRRAYKAVRARLRGEHLALFKAQGLAEFAAGAIALLFAAGCLGWMVWNAIQGRATLGDVALFYQAFSMGQKLVRELLGNVGQIYYNVLFLGNLFEFLDLESRVLSPRHPRSAPGSGAGGPGLGLQFHNVSFCYPGSERLALQGFNLVIPAGQIAAIVGANGAGKSTVLKLLCRFYDPREGRIEIDGVDLRDLSLGDLRGLITVLFQESVHFNATVAENIALDGPMTTATQADIEAMAKAAGADDLIARLPRGYETLLGKWFAGGVELSVGEWQRIALARAFVRRAPVVILDEPTSAMDSWAEADWLQRVRSMVAGRTAIIVTHRFTTAMQADVIHVMDNGCIAESGSHGELLRLDGAYARSWRMQMRAEQSGTGL